MTASQNFHSWCRLLKRNSIAIAVGAWSWVESFAELHMNFPLLNRLEPHWSTLEFWFHLGGNWVTPFFPINPLSVSNTDTRKYYPRAIRQTPYNNSFGPIMNLFIFHSFDFCPMAPMVTPQLVQRVWDFLCFQVV